MATQRISLEAESLSPGLTTGPKTIQPDVVEAVPASAERTARSFGSVFSSLQYPNYRLLWMGTLVSQSGDWMDQMALNWLVYQITGSAVALGLLNLCRFVPILLFTLIGGVVADRWPRRRLLFSTQAIAMVLAFALAVLVSTGLVQFWMVLVIAVGRGTMMSFNQPARQSLISELVPRSSLTNAIALNSATLNFTRILGPTIGGVLIATVGIAGAFYANGASFLAVLLGLMLMDIPPTKARPRKGMVGDLMDGLHYLMGEPRLRTLVLFALVPMVLGMPYMTMLAVFAQDILDAGGTGLSILTAATGMGALVGALIVAGALLRHRRRVMMFALIGFGASLIAFSFSHWLWASAAALAVAGLSQQVYMSLNNTLIQESVDDAYRGRVLSTMFLNRGMVPLGSMIAGVGASVVGAPITIGAMATLLVLMAASAFRGVSASAQSTKSVA
jgi:MFS transporter, DHA1 family, staphyloferrin A biosynthesis exporter